jgi:hypothetical protein
MPIDSTARQQLLSLLLLISPKCLVTLVMLATRKKFVPIWGPGHPLHEETLCHNPSLRSLSLNCRPEDAIPTNRSPERPLRRHILHRTGGRCTKPSYDRPPTFSLSPCRHCRQSSKKAAKQHISKHTLRGPKAECTKLLQPTNCLTTSKTPLPLQLVQ